MVLNAEENKWLLIRKKNNGIEHGEKQIALDMKKAMTLDTGQSKRHWTRREANDIQRKVRQPDENG
jgi:hypothetical protein